LIEYRALGARFAKWRAVISIGTGVPTAQCIRANAHALARYASFCQESGLVPIVEPEVPMDGTHTIDACESATQEVLAALFHDLSEHRVLLEGTVLKPNMVLPGKSSPAKSGVQEVADATVRCLRRTVPPALAGIAFLSGGQSPEQATAHLQAMTAMGPHPWPVTFSYARALQEPALAIWRGDAGRAEEAQRALLRRAQLVSLARQGNYSPALESEP